MVQAQPAFANVNIISDVSESSGPVEKLKGKFAGPQVETQSVAVANQSESAVTQCRGRVDAA